MAFYSLDDPTLWGRETEGWDVLAGMGGLEKISVANFFLGKKEEDAPTATIVRFEPGYVLPHHSHDAYRLEIILEGSMMAGDRELKPGSIMYSGPGVFYGPHVTGPDGCTTVEIFSNFKASHALLLKDASEVVECDLLTNDGAHRALDLIGEQFAD